MRRKSMQQNLIEANIEGLMTELQVFTVWYGIESAFW